MGRKITVVTVTYQSAADIAVALVSAVAAARHAGVDAELIVIDNASSDDSAGEAQRAAPQAVVIRNAVNVGYGSANNQAFQRATGEPWLLLNPDASIEMDALGELLKFYDTHPMAAVVAPSIAGGGQRHESFGPGGAESAGMLPGVASAVGHFLFANRLLPGDRGGAWRGFQLTRRPSLGPRRVEWASGAAALLRPAALRQVGGFDESIFLYGEDVDLGARLGRAGWEAWLVPDARARHGIAASQGGVSTGWVDQLDAAMRSRGEIPDHCLRYGAGRRPAGARDSGARRAAGGQAASTPHGSVVAAIPGSGLDGVARIKPQPLVAAPRRLRAHRPAPAGRRPPKPQAALQRGWMRMGIREVPLKTSANA